MKYIDIVNAKPGMILATTLYDNDARILLTANTVLTKVYINRIRELKFAKICVYENADKERFNSLLDDVTRMVALRNLKKLDIDACLYIANTITNEVLKNPDTIYNLRNISCYDNTTFEHSINVSLLATMIGVNMGLKYETLKNITQAGLLHDIGKTRIDHAIINKDGPLTDDEYEEVKKHTYYGLEILRTGSNCNVSSIVRNTVFSHHENEDGSGYPRQIKGDKIHIVAKIIHVADVYDAIVSKRSYKDSTSSDEAYAFIEGKVGNMFDKFVVNALRNCIELKEDIASAKSA